MRFYTMFFTALALSATLMTGCGEDDLTKDSGAALGPATVNLGTAGYSAGNYVILAESEIRAADATVRITGDLGISPAADSFLFGFSQTLDVLTGDFSISALVTGYLFASDYAGTASSTRDTPAELTAAVGNMMTAYNDAKDRITPDETDLGGGEIGGMTLAPGLYKFNSVLSMGSDVYLNGDANDVWIFQATGITMASGIKIHLPGGALPQNIFWQSNSTATLDSTAHLEGILLCATDITLVTGATVNGRLLSQTAVILGTNSVVVEP